MFDFKLSLSSFRLCRRKNKTPATSHFFSPVNPKVLEIAYPAIPSPPPTTPIASYCNHISKFLNSDDHGSSDIKSSGDVKTMKIKDENNSEDDMIKGNTGDFAVSDGGACKKMMEESLTVVRWSEQPYDDFKRSMLEMILEKEIFEAEDLEKLLQCFLNLNARNHHADIVAAFTEIWEILFR